MPELIIYDVDDEVTINPAHRAMVGEELWTAVLHAPLRIIRIDDVSGDSCDCRRPGHRPHRPMCATKAVERNGGHPQLLFFEVNGRLLRASAAWFRRV